MDAGPFVHGMARLRVVADLLGKVMKQLPEIRALGYLDVAEGRDRVVFVTNGEDAEQGETARTHGYSQVSKKVVLDAVGKNFFVAHTVSPSRSKNVRDADDSGNHS